MNTFTSCILRMVFMVVLMTIQGILFAIGVIDGDWKIAAINGVMLAFDFFVTRILFVRARTIEAMIVLKIAQLDEKNGKWEKDGKDTTYKR